MSADSFGNLYIAGTTSAPDFPVRNAAQAAFGDARVLRSSDLGVTWKPLGSPPADVSAMVADPTAPQVWFAGGASGIYKSTDGGATWRMAYQFTGAGLFNSSYLAIDPGNHLRLAATVPTSGSLIVSVDGGATWTATGNSGGVLTADPTGSGALIAGSTLSRDWGTTFQRLTPPGIGMVFATAFDPSHRGWIYVDQASGVVGTLALTTDFGATWSAKASPSDTFSAMYALTVDPENPNTLVGASPDGLFVSTDGAASWTGPKRSLLLDAFTPLVFPARGCAPPGGLFGMSGAGSTAAVAFSPDYGTTWQTPQLSYVTSVTAGAGCSMYATRQVTTDAFVAKLAPDGTVLWATYLGGSDQDQTVAIAVDAQGDAYVTGSTLSADFPTTRVRIGAAGRQEVFVTKYSSVGGVLWSELVSADSGASASGLAAGSDGSVYLLGRTASSGFPVTPGALVSTIDTGSYSGFLAKLNADGSLAWSTFLGSSYTYGGAVLPDSSGAVTVAGTGAIPGNPPQQYTSPSFVMKLDSLGSKLLAAAYLDGSSAPIGVPSAPVPPNTIALAADRAGNLLVFGAASSNAAATPGAYDAPQPVSTCASRYGALSNAIVTKLAAADWTPLYRAVLRAPCGIVANSIAVDAGGSAVLAMASGQGLPLHSPLLAGPGCTYYGPYNSSAVAKLSPDGSQLMFATYLDNCGAPTVTLGSDGSVYAGGTATTPAGPAGVLHFNAVGAAASVDGIANAFSGDAMAVSENGLYALAVSGVPADGLAVTIAGAPATVVQNTAGRIIVGTPRFPVSRDRREPGFVQVQVSWNGGATAAVWAPVTSRQPGLRTKGFPATPTSEAYALNADGTVNDATHPAPVGSKIALFVTGLGSASRPAPIYTNWDQLTLPPPSSGTPPGITPSPAPGSLPDVYQFQVPVTAAIKSYGTADANGVVKTGLALQFQLYYSSFPPPVSNAVAVYIQ